MKDQEFGMFSAQNRAVQQRGSGLSNVPYYIQELQRQMDRIEYKLNTLLEQKEDKY
jgi:hypothetical protein